MPTPPLRFTSAAFGAARLIWAVLLYVGLAGAPGTTPPTPERAALSLDVWNEAHGLPQSRVRAVLQTRDGYLWLGTDGGLVRFDGVTFQSFNVRSGSLQDDEVWTLAESRTGALWIGTLGGLTRLEQGRFTTYTTTDGLPDNWIRHIDEDREGNLWIATPRGVTRLTGGVFTTFTTKDGLVQDSVSDVCAGSTEGVHVIASFQLHRFENGRFVTEPGLNRPEDGRLTNLSKGADGALWLAFERGVIKQRRAGRLTAYPTLNDPSARGGRIFEDASGNIWVVRRTGLYRLVNGQVVRAVTAELNAQLGAVLSVGTDREGSLWLGLEANGLARVRRTQFVTLTTDDGLPDNSTRSVMQDSRGDIWIGTINGVARWSRGQITSFRESEGRTFGVVTALGEDREGVVWIGAVGELFKYQDGRLTKDPAWKRVQEIKSIYRDREGRMWVCTDGEGLFLCEPNKRPTVFRVEDGLASNHVRGVVLDRRGALWVTTMGAGVSRFADGKFTTFTTQHGLGSDRVIGAHEDEDGTLWFATRAGLTRYRNGKFSNIRARDGLFSEFVSGMLPDAHGYFWFSCSQGIFRVRSDELHAFADGIPTKIASEAYGAKDGLRSTAFGAGLQPNAWRTSDGRLLFSSLKGLVIVDPARLLSNPHAPPVYIERVKVGTKHVRVDQPAVIPAGENEVEIQFTALGFLAPDRIRFRYRLEGLDSKWVDAGPRRYAYFARLPPGEYRFQVIACNEDGRWNDTGATFSFTLTPFLYQRPWFQALCLVGLIGLAGGVHYARLARLRASERELQRRVDEAMANVKVLRGLLPICSSCKNVRDDTGYWNRIDEYLIEHTDTQLTHGICPECIKKLYPDVADQVLRELKSKDKTGS